VTLPLFGWVPGEFSLFEDVYIGQTAELTAANLVSHQPASYKMWYQMVPPLLADQKYYRRIDEVEADGTTIHEGTIWSFTVPDYLPIDDFESCTNDSPKRIFQTWTDGYEFSPDEFFPQGGPDNGTGAAVGHDIWTPESRWYNGSIMETTIVHPPGKKSMPFDYYNAEAPYYSETQRTWTTPQDWTTGGVSGDWRLADVRGPIWGNDPDQLYVVVQDSKGNSTVVPHPDGVNAVLKDQWTEWLIPLTQFTGVDLTNVKMMGIGVGNRTNPVADGAGSLHIDDVRIIKAGQ
jgi:hypothetical protein